MTAFNRGYPINFQQNPIAYAQQQAMAAMQQNPYQAQSGYMQQPQAMTPPTIHADIYQVADEQEAANFSVAAGSSQMMINREETEIYIKSAYANSPATLEVYVKRPPAPPKPEIDPQKYVTWDGLEERLAALTQTRKKPGKPDEGAE